MSLPAGLGSNDVGLDRGQLGETRIVRFERTGPRLLMVQPNYGFRATSDEAYDTARWCLADTLACGILALAYPACTKLLGPVVWILERQQ